MISAAPRKNGLCPTCRAAFARVVLDDHARLPWRFFGRLTAAVQAGLIWR